MPIYNYKCRKCGNTFEEFRSVSDRNNAVCCGDIAEKLINLPAVGVDSTIRDSKGTPIWFPKVGGYHDRALGKFFHTKKQKAEYMKEKGLIQDGSSDPHNKPIEAGDHRFDHRKANYNFQTKEEQ